MKLFSVLKTIVFIAVYVGYSLFTLYIVVASFLAFAMGPAYIGGGVGAWVALIYIALINIQMLMAHNPVFMLIKDRKGNSKTLLVYWFIVIGLTSWIPGFGIYLWYRFRKRCIYGIIQTSILIKIFTRLDKIFTRLDAKGKYEVPKRNNSDKYLDDIM